MTEQTEQIHLTKELALEYMREAVDEYGAGFVYDPPDGTCVYTQNGKASCLIGQVLVRAGVPIEAFEDSGANFARLDYAVLQLPAEISGDLIEALLIAQDTQDIGRTWGEALWRFREAVGSR
jgi:hypothetical protein